MQKLAEVDYGIDHLLRSRWSPRAFASKPVEAEKLRSLFEAARWSPSSANEQPWAFIVGTRDEQSTHDTLVATLTGRNPVWARNAPVLVLSVARLIFESPMAKGRPNRHAYYDVGQAVAHLTVEATALGLVVHQMAGFDVKKARELLRLPEGHDPVTMIAIGYSGDPADLPVELREPELAGRSRKLQSQFVFGGQWGHPLELPAD